MSVAKPYLLGMTGQLHHDFTIAGIECTRLKQYQAGQTHMDEKGSWCSTPV